MGKGWNMARAFGRAVILGLGGTGQSSLLRIKKVFRDYYGQTPPCIKLLAFDTTINRECLDDVNGPLMLDEDEFCHLSVRSVAKAIANPYVSKWWIPYDPINSLSVTTGTGGIREVGRLATFANISTIVALLTRAFTQIWDVNLKQEMKKLDMELLNTPPQVFVVCSFAGGTGSGSFIDFSVLCREVGSRENMSYSAFFVMPWVFRDVAKTAFENGYAALMELENLNNCSAANPYTVSYTPNMTLALKERPYHVVNLIDGESRNGDRVLSLQQIPMFVGDCIFNSVGAAAGKRADVVDNVMAMVALARREDWEGQQAIYSACGTSAIVYPAAAIHEMYSLRYAALLLERSLAFLGKTEDAQKSLEETVKPFLTGYTLSTIKDKIATLNVHPFEAGKKENLRDPGLKAVVVSRKQAWELGQRGTWKIEENALALQKDAIAGTNELLEKIRGLEKMKRCPEGTYRAANQALREHWKKAQEVLGKEHEAESEQRTKLEAKVDSLANEIQKRVPSKRTWWASVANVRNACFQYADACTSLLNCELKLARISKAIHLCGALQQQANDREREWGKVADRLEFTKQTLLAQQVRLESDQSRYTVENLMKQKTLFEIYVGLEEKVDATKGHRDVFSVPDTVAQLMPPGWKEIPQMPGRDTVDEAQEEEDQRFIDGMFEEFQREKKLKDRQAFLALSDEELDTLFLEYARKKLNGIREWPVLELLVRLDKRKPGTIKDLVDQALRSSSQLLPINQNDLTGRDQILTEFTVIGAYYPERLRLEDVIGPHVPTPRPPKIQNIWVNSGDLQRITVTNYFSVVPLYVLRGIDRARDAYLGRVRPPAHIDRNFEFRLLDILPASRNEIKALKLLSLCTLECTGPVIERLEQPDDGTGYYREGHYFYRLNPKVFPQFTSDEELALPGKPGKFYSLYTQLCQDFNVELRDLLTKALIARDDPGNKGAFLTEIQKKYDEFQKILQSRTFNKMITGNLYRQEATFFHAILQGRLSIREALEYKGPLTKQPDARQRSV
jgi:hypothetical protein